VEKIRAFIAINLPDHARASVAEFQQQLQTQIARDGFSDFQKKALRWTRPEQIHLTLKFLGSVPRERIDALCAAFARTCAGTGAFDLAIGDAGCFPSLAKPRVIWVGLDGDLNALRDLQLRVDAATREFSAREENREWTPHLTICRVGKTNDRDFRKISAAIKRVIEQKTNLAFPRASWRVNCADLMQSKLTPSGSVYTPLATAEL